MVDNNMHNAQPLPDGWTWTTIADVCEVERGITFPASAKSTEAGEDVISCLRTSNVQRTVDWDDLIYIPNTFVKREQKLLRQDDILISMANSLKLVGKVSFVDSVPVQSSFGAFIAAIRAFNGIESKYLFYHLRSNDTREGLMNASSQTVNIANLSLGRLNPIPIVMAPLPEQRRIVAEIETQFTRLDAAVAALERAQATLRRYKASVLKAACEGRLVPTEAELYHAGAETASGAEMGATADATTGATTGAETAPLHTTPDRRGAVSAPTQYEPANVLLQRILVERRHRWEDEQWRKEIVKAKKKAAQAKRKAARLPARISDLTDDEWQDLSQVEYTDYLPKNDKWKLKYREPDPPDTKDLSELSEGWEWVRAEQISDFITKGTTPKAHKLYSEQRNDAEIPFIKVYNLTFEGFLDFSVNPTFINQETHTHELSRSLILPSDVLMNIVGPPLGKVSIVPDTFPEWNMNQAVVRYRPFFGYDAKFLSYVLRAEHILHWAVTRAKATAGQFNLTLEICRDLPLPLPPLPEQHRIVAEVERCLSVVAVLETAVAANLRRAERLRQSILKRAFEGRLVPQDPNDEPASVLLARIQAQRAQRQGKKTSRKKNRGNWNYSNE